jgi:anti-sigma-K factor RskA
VEHVDELIPAHALHALDPDESRMVEDHLQSCARCRRQLVEYEAVAGALAYVAPPAQPPAELRDRIMTAIEPVVSAPELPSEPVLTARRRVGWWPRMSVLAAPVLAAAVVGLVIWNVSLRNDVGALHDRLARGPVVHLQGVGTVVSSGDGDVTLFTAARSAPAGKTYELWVIPPGGGPRPAGTFQGGGGTEQVRLTISVRRGDVVAVTVEPARGSKQPTSTPIASARV